ncbi:MAG: NADH pyrophosphatase zinc ribbon domain-containing protein, partial [Gammaproteobacteria bacterium]
MEIVNTISELGNIPPLTPCLFFQGDSVLVLKQQDKYLLPAYQQIDPKLNTNAVFFMTSNEGVQLLAADLNDVHIAGDFSLENIKSIYHLINATERNWIAKTFGFIHWYRKHQFCGICARPTVLDANECAMLCPNCHYHFYPKVNPSMIVLVHRGDEILLARSPHFPPDMF